MLRKLGLARSLPATRLSRTVPIPLYAPCMDGSRINRLLAEMTPDEIELIPRAVRAGWMDADEADEWRRHYHAWQAFFELNQELSNPN